MEKLKALIPKSRNGKIIASVVLVLLILGSVSQEPKKDAEKLPAQTSETASETVVPANQNIPDEPAPVNEAVSPTSQTTTTFEGTIAYVKVINPATQDIGVAVTNTGGVPGLFSCHITSTDPSGTYKGYDTFEGAEPTVPVQPGETTKFAGYVTVTNQGASYANDTSVSCKAR